MKKVQATTYVEHVRLHFYGFHTSINFTILLLPDSALKKAVSIKVLKVAHLSLMLIASG